jgi:hypothetical protein
MKNPTWPKVFAFIGLAIIGLALAGYSATVGTAGVAASLLGKRQDGLDLISMGSAAILIGIAAMAAFSYLAMRGARDLTRR